MLGFTPAEVKAMSIWEYSAAIQGYIDANTSDKSMSADEQDLVWAAVEARMGRVN